MDTLPSELWLKIAQKCDFATACALSKSNKRLFILVWSNMKWFGRHHAEKLHCKSISLNGGRGGFGFVFCGDPSGGLSITFNAGMFGGLDGSSDEMKDDLNVYCTLRTKHGDEKMLQAKIVRGSDDMDAAELLDKGWKHMLRDVGVNARAEDTDLFLGNFLAPIFAKTTIHRLNLGNLKVSTLETISELLANYCPPIYELRLTLGSKDHDLQELTAAARIVKLIKPRHLALTIGSFFTCDEICEHVLKKIAKLKMTKLTFDSGKWFGTEGVSSESPIRSVPLPKVALLQWYPANLICSNGFGQIVRLSVTDVVTLVKEWSYNERDIVSYNFGYHSSHQQIVYTLLEHLRAENLPIEIHDEVRRCRIEKLDKRGNDQDDLIVGYGLDDSFNQLSNEERWAINIRNLRGLAGRRSNKLDMEIFEKCRFC